MWIDRHLQALHQDQFGLFSLSHLATTLFLTFISLGLLNVSGVLHDRSDQQRQTDAVATALGNWKARHLNAIVAHQHTVGDMLSLAIVHHAIGGELLDQQVAADTRRADERLRLAAQLARRSRTGTPAYDDVSRPVLAGEALLAAQIRLKQRLTQVYDAKAAATAMQAFPPTRPAGEALETLAELFEQAIWQEWRVLDDLYKRAVALTPTKLALLQHQLPAAMQQLHQMVEHYPQGQQQLAEELQHRLNLQIHILPTDRRLPIKIDPWATLTMPPPSWQRPSAGTCPTESADHMRHQIVKVTQLARATFPWVNYHRKPLVSRLESLTPISNMGELFFDHTNGVSKRMLDELQADGACALYVLDDYQGPDKAYEVWTAEGGDAAADRTFGLTVMTARPVRTPYASKMFGQAPQAWAYRVASALAWQPYVPQQPSQQIDLHCKRIVPSYQAATGWDTLNWAPAVSVPELVGFGLPHIFPQIQPDWRSRLSPTSPARWQQLTEQPLPTWASELPSRIPADLSPELADL